MGRSRASLPVDCRIEFGYNVYMKLTLQLQLVPTPTQKAGLLTTMERFNEAATFAAKVGFEAGVFGQVTLHRLAYREIRERFGLSSQMAIRAIAKAVECFHRDKTKCPVFKPRSAVCYDRRVLSFKGLTTVSLWAMSGRLLIPFVCGDYQRERQGRIKGECDLIYRHGKFYLLCTIDMPENAPVKPADVLGVDLGIVNIAADSSGETFSGAKVEKVRQRYGKRRAELNGVGTKSARRRLSKIRKQEANFRRNENHRISKQVVAKAKATGCAIALEDLNGIRDRVTVKKPQRNRHAGWSFHQLRLFLEYKAGLAGVPIVLVDPRNTSRTCPECGHCEKANRKSQAQFACRHCGYSANAERGLRRCSKHPDQGHCQVPHGITPATKKVTYQPEARARVR
jgi:putative transposase